MSGAAFFFKLKSLRNPRLQLQRQTVGEMGVGVNAAANDDASACSSFYTSA
jgi:hypothetical protein